MIEEIKEHLVDYKWFYISATLIVGLFLFIVWYEYNYPCVSGHYETQYYLDPNLKVMMPREVFICDCRTVRDSLN